MRIGPIWTFANRHIIGIRIGGNWQADYMLGPRRILSYRRGIRTAGRHYIDLGRHGILRWGRLRTTTPQQEDQ